MRRTYLGHGVASPSIFRLPELPYHMDHIVDYGDLHCLQSEYLLGDGRRGQEQFILQTEPMQRFPKIARSCSYVMSLTKARRYK